MSRLFRAGANLALTLGLIPLGVVTGCGGPADVASDEAVADSIPTAEPGQTAIPETNSRSVGLESGTEDAETKVSNSIPVTEEPSEPGIGP